MINWSVSWSLTDKIRKFDQVSLSSYLLVIAVFRMQLFSWSHPECCVNDIHYLFLFLSFSLWNKTLTAIINSGSQRAVDFIQSKLGESESFILKINLYSSENLKVFYIYEEKLSSNSSILPPNLLAIGFCFTKFLRPNKYWTFTFPQYLYHHYESGQFLWGWEVGIYLLLSYYLMLSIMLATGLLVVSDCRMLLLCAVH